jgi:succinate dehydrogenase flavin-adding protein (antitoxin of CptAB toxin-antitoxin module)
MNRFLLRIGYRCSQAEYRYSPIETETNALRGQLLFRAKNLGMRELDLIVGSWAKLNFPQFSHQKLMAFNDEVMNHETPELLKKILGQIEIS